MNQLLVGYARVSTEQQDLTAQREQLAALGVGDDRIYVDHGLTGTNRDRPGLRLALAACHSGDTLVVTKLDRLARRCPTPATSSTSSPGEGAAQSGRVDPRPDRPDRAAVVQRAGDGRGVRGGPDRMRTREGLKVAKAKGRLRGKQPKLTKIQSGHLLELHAGGTYTTAELAELFSVGRATVYRTIHRDPPPPQDPYRPFAEVTHPAS